VLVKLNGIFSAYPVVDFINILRAAFAPICQKSQSQTVNREKLQNIFVHKIKAARKMLVKLTPLRRQIFALSHKVT